ncbi:TauD/TfdA family dioxygenase [Kitasatospora mediocidica]|uniref:TauD/TfdA family dioxygenase n=1 Tax=Kitasatospora mediocidica TaxID=58352 RepID=UPI000A02B524|nr:TauD/TfdA family dioxygenase [Kitasatospora mediocidica]
MVEHAAVGGGTVWERDTLTEADWLVPFRPPAAGGATAPEPAARVVRRLRSGPGLALLRGVDLDGLDDGQCVELCRRLVARVAGARPRGSGVRPENLLVAASGPSASERDDQGLGPHTDRSGFPGSPRVLALLCVRPALYGGESLLVSGHAVHDRLLAGRPGVLQQLYQDFDFGRGPDFERIHPVFRRTADGLRVQYNRYWIGRGQDESGVPFTPAQAAALEAFDEVLADPRMVVRLRLRRGDLLLLDNTVVLHGRTAFTDPPLQGSPRCLARVWAD